MYISKRTLKIVGIAVLLVIVGGVVFTGSFGVLNALPAPSGLVSALGSNSTRYYAGDQPAQDVLRREVAPASGEEANNGRMQFLSEANLDAAKQQGQQGQQSPQEPPNRIILKTATLSIVVEDSRKSLDSIAQMATEMGGWVVSSNTSRVRTASGEEVANGSIVIRVPLAKLDAALGRIKSGAGSVTSEKTSGQDVTQQYVDLSSRAKNLEAAEVQLRNLMDKAIKPEDVLAAFNQLTQIRGEIETLKGQIKYFEQAAAFSSISVQITPKVLDTPIQIAGWSPSRTVERALASLVNMLRGLADAVITLAVVGVPLVLIFGVPAWLIYRLVRRRMKPSAAAS
jgi:hypothetical protein